jgi:hypothetical protein
MEEVYFATDELDAPPFRQFREIHVAQANRNWGKIDSGSKVGGIALGQELI